MKISNEKNQSDSHIKKIYTRRGTRLRGYELTAGGTMRDSWLFESWHNLDHELWKYPGMIQVKFWTEPNLIRFRFFLNAFWTVLNEYRVTENRYGAEQRTVGMGMLRSGVSAVAARYMLLVVTKQLLVPRRREPCSFSGSQYIKLASQASSTSI